MEPLQDNDPLTMTKIISLRTKRVKILISLTLRTLDYLHVGVFLLNQHTYDMAKGKNKKQGKAGKGRQQSQKSGPKGPSGPDTRVESVHKKIPGGHLFPVPVRTLACT